MLDPKKLISFEYFPVELPSCFTTKDVVKHYADMLGQINATNYGSSIPLFFTAYKNEHARRRMALPNLYHYFKIVELLCKNEATISSIYNGSNYSLTKPSNKQKNTENRAFNRVSNSPNETRAINEKLFQDNTLCLKLDINNFFDSIYTHSISWAIHTKAVAKKNSKDMTLFGNALDKCLQGLNDKQTHGILIGNAVSRLISEIILCKIDENIKKEFKNINLCRYVDDYAFYLKEGYSQNASIEQIICFVRNQLLEYDLILNETKTTVLKAPFVLGQNGIDEIKSVAMLDPYHYFNRMVFIYNKYQDISLIKYGMKVVQCLTTKENIHSVFPLIINLWARFPNLAEYILPVLYDNKDELSKKEKEGFRIVLQKVFEEGVAYRHDVEVVWATWAMFLFEYPITSRLLKLISNTNNDFAILIALDSLKESKPKYFIEALQSVIARVTLDINGLMDEDSKDDEAMLKQHWFLVYELVVKGIVTDGDLVKYVKDNRFFKKMLDLKIDMYDASAKPINKQYKTVAKQNREKLRKIILDLSNLEKDDAKKEELVDKFSKIVTHSSGWDY